MRHKTKVDTIGQKLTQSDRSQSYPDIESCEEVGSLVDDMGELVAAQLLVVVDVTLLKHLHRFFQNQEHLSQKLHHLSQKLHVQMECLKRVKRVEEPGGKILCFLNTMF